MVLGGAIAGIWGWWPEIRARLKRGRKTTKSQAQPIELASTKHLTAVLRVFRGLDSNLSLGVQISTKQTLYPVRLRLEFSQAPIRRISLLLFEGPHRQIVARDDGSSRAFENDGVFVYADLGRTPLKVGQTLEVSVLTTPETTFEHVIAIDRTPEITPPPNPPSS